MNHPLLSRTIAICLLAALAVAADAPAAEPPDFGPAVQVSPPLPHPYYGDPDLAVRDGRRVAVWTKTRFGRQSWVQAAELDAAGHRGPVTSIAASPDSGWDNDPAVALSSAGTAAVAWEGSVVLPPPVARLSILGTDLTPGPTQSLDNGYDPAVAYPPSGDGLLAWSGSGSVSVAPIDPAGNVGAESTIPLEGGDSRAGSPAIEFGPDGARVYWSTSAGIFESRVRPGGVPDPARLVLPPADYGFRGLVVSGDLLVALRARGRAVDLVCVPLGGGPPVVVDSRRGARSGVSPIRVGSADVDAVGTRGLISWVKQGPGSGSWAAKAATVDSRCRVDRIVSLPTPGRRANDTEVGHDGRSPLALVAAGGGLESVGLSRSGKVRDHRRIAKTRPFSKKIEKRTPVTHLELVTEPDNLPTAVWSQTHRGPGRTIAASVAR